ncbi:MAG: hypothetical protein ACYCRH_08385 [Acidiferrobacteraceae bacterium]
MTTSEYKWLALRIGTLAVSSWSIGLSSRSGTNLDWTACLLIPAVFGLCLFLWLLAIRDRDDIDWSDPFSLTKPFFPMRGNPVRFWLLGSLTLIIGGLIALLESATSGARHLAFGATFFALGIVTLVVIGVWLKACGNK